MKAGADVTAPSIAVSFELMESARLAGDVKIVAVCSGHDTDGGSVLEDRSEGLDDTAGLFGVLPAAYSAWDRYSVASLRKMCMEIVDREGSPSGVGVDIGAGTCVPTECVGSIRPGQMIALDRSAAMLSQANPKAAVGSLQRIVADARNLPFSDSAIDLAMIFNALHLLPDLQTVLREVSRILKPGGTFAVVRVDLEDLLELTFNRHLPGLYRLEAQRHISNRRLERLCRAAGLDVECVAKYEIRRVFAELEDILEFLRSKPFDGLTRLSALEIDKGAESLRQEWEMRDRARPIVTTSRLTMSIFRRGRFTGQLLA